LYVNIGKKLLYEPIITDIIRLSDNICKKQHTLIKTINTDNDHIHYLLETEPTVTVSKLISTLKSYTTYHIWKLNPEELSLHFWKEHTFWTDGYFICSIGNVSEQTLREYIEEQG
jgi:putative transposase